METLNISAGILFRARNNVEILLSSILRYTYISFSAGMPSLQALSELLVSGHRAAVLLEAADQGV